MVGQAQTLAVQAPSMAHDVTAERAGAPQTTAGENAETSRTIQIGRAAAVVIPIALWFAPLPLERPAQKAIAVTSFMIIAWITHALDHAVTGLIGCYLFWALGVAKVEIALCGFSSSTPWFLFGPGLVAEVGWVEVLWSRWLLDFLPVTGLTILVAWRLALWLYPPEPDALAERSHVLHDKLRALGPWSTLEKKTAILMSIAISLWMTDRLHQLSPAIVALGVALAATLPAVRVLDVEDLKKVNYLPVFFVAAAVSMSQVLVSTKALDVLTKVMFGWMEPLLGNIYSSTFVLYWTAFVYHIFLGDEVSMLSSSIPPLMNYATAHGLS